MKLGVITDTHGSLERVEKVLGFFEKEGVEILLHLGDVLAHGPRNPLPPSYSPLNLAQALLSFSGVKIFVRGNCDAPVDEMVMEAPFVGDYFFSEGFLFTHGHVPEMQLVKYAEKLGIGGVVRGHFHKHEVKKVDSVNLITLSSLSIPRNSPPTVAVLEGGVLNVYNAEDFSLLVSLRSGE